MKLIVAVLLGVVCSQAYGAVYTEKEFAKIPTDGPVEPSAHELIPALPVPKEEDTLHKGLVSTKRKGDVRAVAPAVDTLQKGAQTDIINIHNTYRRKVATTSTFQLTWDEEARAKALAWVSNCDYRHPTQSPTEQKQYMSTSKFSCGQNIAMSKGYVMDWPAVTAMWYSEIGNFTYNGLPKSGGVVGHFTAMVWDKTFQLGCAYAKCKAGTPSEFNFYACNYCPAGNITPNQYKPYEAGTKCGKCPNNCSDGLCTNPCGKTNEYSNCESGAQALFPKGCDGAPDYLAKFKANCQATCSCYGKSLY